MLQQLDDLLTILRMILSIQYRISANFMYCFRLCKFALSKRMDPNEKELGMLLNKWNELNPALRRTALFNHDPRVGDTFAYAVFILTIGMGDIKYILNFNKLNPDERSDMFRRRRLMIDEFVMPLVQDKPRMWAIINADNNSFNDRK